MVDDSIRESIDRYYTGKITEHGPGPAGADWNSVDGQVLRFRQLMNVCRDADEILLADIGCGYGAMIDHIVADGRSFLYEGVDLSEAMIDEARRLYGKRADVRLTVGMEPSQLTDFVVASGIFNVAQETSRARWEAYVLETISMMDRHARRGFAFNLLTSYSDPEHRRPHLYYAVPEFFFGFCKQHFSREVALLHDYGLYEFTIVVRK